MSITTFFEKEEESIVENTQEFETLAIKKAENYQTNSEQSPENNAEDSGTENEKIPENGTKDNNISEALICSQSEKDLRLKEKDIKADGAKEENESEITSNTELNLHKNENGHTVNEEEKENIIRCESCFFDEIEEKAVAFCAVCIEYLCNSCACVHRRSKVTRSHKILDEYEMPTCSSIFKMMKSMISCPEHQEIEVSYRCEQHEKFICTKCLLLDHRTCKEVKEISNPSMPFTRGDSGLSLKGRLKSIHEKTVSVRIAKEENLKKMLEDHASFIKDQEAFIERLQEHQLKLKKETESLLNRESEKLQRDIDECKSIESTEINYKELLDVAVQYGSTTELNVISALTVAQVDRLQDKTEKQAKTPPNHVTFRINNDFIDIASLCKELVERDEKLNDLHNESHSSLQNSSDAIDTDDIDENRTSLNAEANLKDKPLMQSTIKKTRSLHDLRDDDTQYTCLITKILLLTDGRIAVTDYNNQNITILNSDFTVKFAERVDGNPIDMCQTGNNHLVAIFDCRMWISRYIVYEDNIVHNGGFPTKLYPISIDKSHESDDEIVVLFSNVKRCVCKRSDNDTIIVQIRNLQNGQILQQLTSFECFINRRRRELILENTNRIRVVLQHQNTFLVSEKEKVHGFKIDNVRTNELKEICRYNNLHETSIKDDVSDIATDKEGNIYICRKNSRNIHQISGSNPMDSRILLSVPGIPISICVDDDRRLLIIGCRDDDCIYIAPFD